MADHFENWIVVDTTDISGNATAHTMKMLCEKLEIPATTDFLSNPALLDPQNDTLHFQLRLNRFAVKIGDVLVQCILQSPGGLDHLGTDESYIYIPSDAAVGAAPYECMIGTIDNLPDSLATYRELGPLNIMATAEHWMRFNPKLREILIRENIIGLQMGNGIIRTLERSVERLSGFRRLTVDDLSSSTINTLKGMLWDDVQKLLSEGAAASGHLDGLDIASIESLHMQTGQYLLA